MARISVSEAADRLGVNVQRVHQLIADCSLPAERVGHQWVIEEADLVRLDRRPAGRPLSPKSAWAVALVADLNANDPGVATIAAPDQSRARARLLRLLSEARRPHLRRDEESAAADLAADLRSLLRGRAERRLLRASTRDLDDLRSDARIRLSGVSLPESGIAAGDIVEGYVADDQLDGLVNDFLLVDARHGEANVVLHIFNLAAIADWRFEPNNWLLLAADLAEHHRPREMARAAQLVREAAEQHPGLAANEPR